MNAPAIPLSPEGVISANWTELRREAEAALQKEPDLTEMLKRKILDRQSFQEALAHLICDSLKTADDTLPLEQLVASAHATSIGILPSASADLAAIQKRDPASMGMLTIFLFFKGFVGLEAYRVGHWLWARDRRIAAAAFQSRIARCLGLDIHPGARIGKGVMMDHAQGIVIGETALIEDDVSLLHNVTLGGTGTVRGDRHPKIRRGVMIGAGAKILGAIEVGEGSRIAAGSVVLKPVPPHVTVAGVPARVIGHAGCDMPSDAMDQTLVDFAASI